MSPFCTYSLAKQQTGFYQEHLILSWESLENGFIAVVLNQGQLPPPRGHLAMHGDIFGCHNWVGEEECTTGVWWVEVKDDAGQPAMHRAASNHQGLIPIRMLIMLTLRKPVIIME